MIDQISLVKGRLVRQILVSDTGMIFIGPDYVVQRVLITSLLIGIYLLIESKVLTLDLRKTCLLVNIKFQGYGFYFSEKQVRIVTKNISKKLYKIDL
jgi:hypothetical protein